ncbi:4Fe-4S dicluster domain-containing protein [bacterium]|jgi:Na+-transporting NADH:ubiquinone oxidoreductase subunit A|nr:4Fe-4S dicluster domain-containing protein [bacterium]
MTMKKLTIDTAFDLRLQGAPSADVETLEKPKSVALIPSSIPFIKPKLSVKEGDKVQIGTPLFVHKHDDRIQFLSPGSGVVEAIQYGPKRRLDAVVICLDEQETQVSFDKITQTTLETTDRETLIGLLLKGGLWSSFREFPFKKIPNPETSCPSIYVTLDNDEPFHPEASVYLDGRIDQFKFGLDILKKLSKKVHVCSSTQNKYVQQKIASNLTHRVSGNYPANQAGTILYTDKTKASENGAWTISAQELIRLADLLQTGCYPIERVVVAAGSSAKVRKHYTTRVGVPIQTVLKGQTEFDHPVRVVAGGVYTGRATDVTGYLGSEDFAVHILPNSIESEFMSFVMPGADKPSYSRAFVSTLFRTKKWAHTTAINGGERSCIACTKCADVCPVDIQPQFLMKTLEAGDVEDGMALGLLDCVTCGLCTYVCPSKIDLDHIFTTNRASLEQEARS